MKKSISDKDMTSANALELIGDIVESLEPFVSVRCLNVPEYTDSEDHLSE